MKLKVRPEDFRVEELIRLRLGSRGRYAVYRLEKRRWNTLDVLDYVARKYHLNRLARAGLKDRYSLSLQYVSIPGDGPKVIRERDFSLKLAGRSAIPVSRDLLLGNRFAITLRDLSSEEVAAVARNLPPVVRDGFANYYDEQRFGSARHGEGFFARRLILGHFNGALKLYMATPSAYDDRETRASKQFLGEHWGDWALCLKRARAEFAPILRHLVAAPKDFEGALRWIRPDLMELFLNSYQSHIWNETVSALILGFGLPTRTVAISENDLLFYRELNPAARRFFEEYPIPAAGQGTEFTSERIERVVNTVLIREGLTLREMKPALRMRGVFFKPFLRPGVVVPEELQVSRPTLDELYSGRQKLTLSFTLPPGSYATILVKRLLLGASSYPGTNREDADAVQDGRELEVRAGQEAR